MRMKVICTAALTAILIVSLIAPINMTVGTTEISEGPPEGWSEDIRLTYHEDGWDSRVRIASQDNIVHVVWERFLGEDEGYYDVFYMKSEDNGWTWSEPLQLSFSELSPRGHDIAVHEDTVYVAWSQRGPAGAREIFFRRSLDGGDTWEDEQQITQPTGEHKTGPTIAVSDDGMIVHVAWTDSRHGGDLDTDIYYIRSTDGGVTWEEEVRITEAPWTSSASSIVVDGSTVHLVWNDERKGYMIVDIYYRRSTDHGATWGEEVALSDSSNGDVHPDVAVWDGNVHVVWEERLGTYDYAINYRRSTDNGDTWEAMQVLTAPSARAQGPTLDVKEYDVHVVWYDDRVGWHEIYYKHSGDGGISWEEDTRLTYSIDSISAWPVISLSGDMIHVAWYDNRDGDYYEIYYKRYPDFNDEPISEFSSLVVPVVTTLLMVGVAISIRRKRRFEG